MASAAPARHRFSVDEYHRLADALIGDDARVELLDGEVIDMAPIGSRHAACVDRLTRLLTSRLAERAIVRVQNPIQLSDRSEPQPDVAVVSDRPDFYVDAHPSPADVLLLIEVADTTLAWDLDIKTPLYANAGIPEVWVVDLDRQAIAIFRQPGGDGYAESRQATRGDRLELLGVSVAVDEILG